MKPNANYRMSKSLKIMLTNMTGDNKIDYKREMIKAIIAPRIEFKKKPKDNDEVGTS